MKRVAILLLLVLFSSVPLFAQQVAEDYIRTGEVSLDYFLPADVSYNPDIPKPADILGHEVGEWHLRHDLLVRYLDELAKASDRVTINHYGKTHEKRPLVLLTITAPENHQNIEEIRQQHVSLTNPAESDNLNVDDMPVVVWLGYSVHGNEHSGANAAILSAYYYAAAQGPEIEQQLRETVILLDPSFNPDGQARFVSWVNSHRSLRRHVSDPSHREFNEPWPRSRTNHYWFDLNRDWMPLQHPESRYRLEQFHHWKPNVLTDHHEMGTNSTYFFQPGIPSRNNPLTPERNYELTGKLAEYHAASLDRFGHLYYSKESFDDFYMGKGSSYPDLNGTIGILFEQASSRGHAQESVYGLLHFPKTILNQFLTSISTVDGAHELRSDFLNFQREFYTSARDEARSDNVKAWVFGDEHDPAKVFHLLEILNRHQIDIYTLGRDVSSDGKTFTAGKSYIIPGNQPQYRLIRSFFETRTSFTDSLFYDVSTWSLPHAFNLNHAELGGRAFNTNLLGDKVSEPTFPEGKIIGGQARYAYVFEWDGYYAPRALYTLQDAGLNIQLANAAFTAETSNGRKTFTSGAIIVALGIQHTKSSAEVHKLMRSTAAENAIDVYALNTGLSSGGIDLGSPSITTLRKPEVLLVTGDGVNASEAGETWHLLDQRYHMPVTMVETSRMNSLSLDRYNTIVFVSGNYGMIQEGAINRLKTWASSGGVIIGYKNAANWLASNNLATVEFERQEDDESTESIPYADANQNRGAQFIGGSIFNTNVDLTHPLLYGYNNAELSVFRNSTTFFKAPKNRYAAPIRYTNSPLVSGYISSENLDIMPNTAAVIVSGVGSGRTILMADNPNFRAFWFGTNKLFANALFFGNTINWATVERGEE